MRLKEDFYINNADILAPKLLGKLLCRNAQGEIIKLRITETECYLGVEDTACHAHKGRTPRTEVLFQKGGIAYVYLCYGIHNLFNVVTGQEENPQAVLIRAVEGFNGPGKLTKALRIDRAMNRENLITSQEIWIEEDGTTPTYIEDKRVGIDYATQEYRNKLWRFIVK